MDRTITLSKHKMVVDRYDYECMVKELKQLRKLKNLVPNKDKLHNIAYKIATSTCTTRIMTEKQWSKCKISNCLWEPFENLGEDFVKDHVLDIAHSIIREFTNLAKEVK